MFRRNRFDPICLQVVNTVNFSNHSGGSLFFYRVYRSAFVAHDTIGYARFGGSRTSASELTQIFGMMEQNELLSPERLLTGYIPGAEATAAVTALAVKLRERDPNLIYLLDRAYIAQNHECITEAHDSRPRGFRETVCLTRRYTHIPCRPSPCDDHHTELVRSRVSTLHYSV